jgi:hypothetical protein
MEDLGACQYILGMRVTRNRAARTLTLSQDWYSQEILDEFGLLDCKSSSVLLPTNVLSMPVKANPPNASFNFHRGVGLLQYLVQCTRPDLAYAFSYHQGRFHGTR